MPSSLRMAEFIIGRPPTMAYAGLQAQTGLLTFMDCFLVLGVVTLATATAAWLTRKFNPGGAAAAD